MTTRTRPTRRCAALALALAGCAPAVAPAAGTPWRTVVAEEALVAVMLPGPAHRRQAHEGPVVVHLVTADDGHGATYEVASFALPEQLDEGRRRELDRRVVVGVAGGPGARVTARAPARLAGVAATRIDVALSGDRAGTWWLAWPDRSTMVQVSVVGPAGPVRDQGAERFAASLRWVGATGAPASARAAAGQDGGVGGSDPASEDH